ncbi:MAG TPA: DUF4062 domain-containing protein, partial [Pirellulaceae bacterium]|nr:DUF4062 domain-containing protein [Pirellulaceae bacterium]
MSQSNERPRQPIVFIASTAEDLKEHRERARDAAIRFEFFPRMYEYWPARDNPPLDECLRRVDEADVVVVLVAHRYGWIPARELAADGQMRSITWLECEQAVTRPGRELLVFVVDPSYAEWPEEKWDAHRMTVALKDDRLKRDRAKQQVVLAEVQRDIDRLDQFKEWVGGENRIVRYFTTPDNVRAVVGEALHDWLRRNPRFGGDDALEAQRGDPSRYLRNLLSETDAIKVRGLRGGDGPKKFSIDKLYVTLRSIGAPGGKSRSLTRKESVDAGKRASSKADKTERGDEDGSGELRMGDGASASVPLQRWLAERHL